MTKQEVLQKLQELGTEQTVNIYHNHGCDIETYGVSIANLKKVLRPIKKDKALGKELFLSDNSDAIYLSQWVADPTDVTIEEIEDRVLLSNFYMLIEFVIPTFVVQNRELSDQCLERWLEHDEPRFRQAAYSLYALMVGTYPDDTLDMNQISFLLDHIEQVIHSEENRVRYSMNSFVIAVGAFISSMHQRALEVANTIGKVSVNMGKTACKVPLATSSIKKTVDHYGVGHKRN